MVPERQAEQFAKEPHIVAQRLVRIGRHRSIVTGVCQVLGKIRLLPDFEIVVHTENDVPGVSIREAQIKGTHGGEYCGVQATGRRVSVPLIGLFLFDTTTGHLNAERIYFDNNTILAQIRGEMSPEDVFDLGTLNITPPPQRASERFTRRALAAGTLSGCNAVTSHRKPE